MNTHVQQPYLQIIDQATQTRLVRAVLRNDSAEITAWHADELYGGGSGSQIFKVTGEACTQDGLTPWSLVLKLFHLQSEGVQRGGADPAAWNYWKREWLLYQAEWLADLPPGLVPPRCLGIGEHPGIAAWIAVEDLSHVDSRPWPLAHFRTVARHVGHFNGAYLVGQPVPADPWLSRDWLRGSTEEAAPMVALLPRVTDNVMVRQIFSDTMIGELIQLWDVRDSLFAALDALPQTFCHHDIFPRNVFVLQTEHGEQTIAIDWAFAGQGAIGGELAPLVGGSLTFFEADPVIAEELEKHCLDGYLEGLQAAGWHGDPGDVHFGYLASLVLRFSVGALVPVLTIALDETLHSEVEQRFGRSMEAFKQNLRATMEFLVRRSVEARRLLASRQATGKVNRCGH